MGNFFLIPFFLPFYYISFFSVFYLCIFTSLSWFWFDHFLFFPNAMYSDAVRCTLYTYSIQFNVMLCTVWCTLYTVYYTIQYTTVYYYYILVWFGWLSLSHRSLAVSYCFGFVCPTTYRNWNQFISMFIDTIFQIRTF